MKLILYLALLAILISSVAGYDNIIQYDMNEDIIFSTTVYNTSGMPCIGCTCNLSVYSPHPNENIIYTSVLLDNKGQGVYSYNLTNTIPYDKKIYPIVLVCNDSSGFFGGEEREGIKIGESLFDYTSLMLVLFGVGAVLIFSSFFIDKKLFDLRLITFFGGFPFLIAGMFTALQIAKLSPSADNFIIIFDIMFYMILMIFLVIIYLYAKHRIAFTAEEGLKIK